MDEIDSLSLRIKDLSHSVDFWNGLMLWGLALAAVAAVFVVIATRIVVSQTGKLSEAQDLLSAAKDRIAVEDSKDKDGKISLANKAASDANERAAKLEVEAGKLRLQLSSQERRSNVLLQPQIRTRFGSRVKPFAGQYFDVLTCRMHESEMAYFSMSIWGTLSGDLANWNIGKLEDVGSCAAGLLVMVEPDAPASTREAAQSLLGAFVEVGLAPSNSTVVNIAPPPPNAGDPGVWFLAASRTDAVLVLVGPHP